MPRMGNCESCGVRCHPCSNAWRNRRVCKGCLPPCVVCDLTNDQAGDKCQRCEEEFGCEKNGRRRRKGPNNSIVRLAYQEDKKREARILAFIERVENDEPLFPVAREGEPAARRLAERVLRVHRPLKLRRS